MTIAGEIRKQIEKNKELKLAVGEINNHLSVLEGLTRKDIMEQVDEAYQKGYDKGYADKTNNDEVCKQIAKDIQDEAYQRGLDDAWEAARRIAQQWENDTDTEHRVVIDDSIRVTLDSMTASEAIEKLKSYEEKQKAEDEIKVGDEVIYNGTTKCLVVRPETDERYAVLIDSNGNHHHADHSECKKTGRHFDIASILEDMRND